MFAPAWQTGELEEEWVEASPPPPAPLSLKQAQALAVPPPLTETLPRTQDSVRAKRGSLRALGRPRVPLAPVAEQAAAREKGPDGQMLTATATGAGTKHHPIRSHSVGSGGLISPPTSRSSSGNSAAQQPSVPTTMGPPSTIPRDSTTHIPAHSAGTLGTAAATLARGTFVVKEGVEDDRGAALAARGRGGAGGARGGAAGGGLGGLFGPSRLERMFEPPSPPAAGPSGDVATAQAVSAPPPLSTQPSGNEVIAPTTSTFTNPAPKPGLVSDPIPARRLSHQHAPPIPSRLSKSITPSLPSTSMSASQSGGSEDDEIDRLEAGGRAAGTRGPHVGRIPSADRVADASEEEVEQDEEEEVGLPSLPGIEPEAPTETFDFSLDAHDTLDNTLAPHRVLPVSPGDADDVTEQGGLKPDEAEPDLSFSPSLGLTPTGDPSHSTLPRHGPASPSRASAQGGPHSRQPKQHTALSPRRAHAAAGASAVRARLTSSNLRLSQTSFSRPGTDRSPNKHPARSPVKGTSPRNKPTANSRPRLNPNDQSRLRLFRSTYDTYTREHLSALVDSIALDRSGSGEHSGSRPLGDHSGVGGGESGEADESDVLSRSRSQSGPGPGGPRGQGAEDEWEAQDEEEEADDGERDDTRSSKRMRMSPRSPTEGSFQAAGLPRPQRAPGPASGLRGEGKEGGERMDWGGLAREMMARIKDKGPGGDSTTTAEGEGEEGEAGEEEWEDEAEDGAAEAQPGAGGLGLGDILGRAIAENLVQGDISYFSPVSSPDKPLSDTLSRSQSPQRSQAYIVFSTPGLTTIPGRRPTDQGTSTAIPVEGDGAGIGTYRSKTSTTSSTYLREAQDLMSRIKARVVSVSNESDGGDGSAGTASDRAEPAERTERAGRGRPGEGKTSPRRMLRRLSASEEVRRLADAGVGMEEEEEERDEDGEGVENVDVLIGQDEADQTRRDDLHRFLSSTTHRTMTATATATFPSTIGGTGMYLKHPGPATAAVSQGDGSGGAGTRGKGRAGMRTLGPEEVAGFLGGSAAAGAPAGRVGGMRFDAVGMRWVRDRPEDAGITGVSGDSRAVEDGVPSAAEEEVDVFAHFSSSDGSSRRTSTPGAAVGTSSVPVSVVDDADHNEPPAPHPHRPTPVHAVSAPAVLTPLPPSKHQAAPPRSALRQANTPLRPALEGGRKRAGWHESVTPVDEGAGVGQGGEGRAGRARSVSFSDGRTPGDDEAVGRSREHEHELEGLKDLTLSDLTPSKPGKTRKQSHAELQDDVWPIPHDSYSTPNPFQSYSHNHGYGRGAHRPSTASRLFGSLPRDETVSGEEDMTVLPDVSTPRPPLGNGPAKQADTLARGDRTFGGRSTRSVHPEKTFTSDHSFHVADPALVRLITDVYGSEPHWEELEVLDLRGKGVESVRRLEEFCGSSALQEAYLDNNKLSYLTGLPASVQVLHVPDNRLTSLSSFGHLVGLRELDLSGNKLEQLTHLACLTNLEILKVDKNKVDSLGGILEMRKLRELSVRGNKVDKVDLRMAQWPELKVLNISGNRLTTIKGLANLPKLKEIDLDNNQLTSLEPSAPLTSLRSLRVSSNLLTELDLGLFPGLRTLYADNNELCAVGGSSIKSRLTSLSLRSQRASGLAISSALWSTLQRVYLSGNTLAVDFWPRRECRSMVYLELGACSLRALPEMGRVFPSVQALNLNFNQLTSLISLRGLSGLRKLSVVGNQLGDAGLKGLDGLKALEEVDFRMNPLTLPFYLPVISSLPLELAPAEAPEPIHRLNARPLPSVTQATIHPSALPGASSFALGLPSPPAGQQWAALDQAWRHRLPDEVYARRMVYRALVCRALGGVRRVDGLEVGKAERKKGEMLLLRAAGADMGDV